MLSSLHPVPTCYPQMDKLDVLYNLSVSDAGFSLFGYLFYLFFIFLINLFFIGVQFANIQNNTQCSSRQVPPLGLVEPGFSLFLDLSMAEIDFFLFF